MMNILLVSVCY